MKREIIQTSDGSTTIHIPQWNEQYHSIHGAIQEAYHVFIKQGLSSILVRNIAILEIGFGTGLNSFITFLEAKNNDLVIDYVGVDAYPVQEEEIRQLNYISQLNANQHQEVFKTFHSCEWGIAFQVNSNFSLLKRKQFFHEINDQQMYDLIYFDAFGARVQPEVWTEEIFTKMFNALKLEGILVTYSAKGSVRRAMLSAGFSVERLEGPPGKREMLRATKQKLK